MNNKRKKLMEELKKKKERFDENITKEIKKAHEDFLSFIKEGDK